VYRITSSVIAGPRRRRDDASCIDPREEAELDGIASGLGETLAAVVLNAAWVLGSIAVIELGPLTTPGNLAVAAVALAVLAFAILEILGLRRLREADAS
jgi:hypothetical protein